MDPSTLSISIDPNWMGLWVACIRSLHFSSWILLWIEGSSIHIPTSFVFLSVFLVLFFQILFLFRSNVIKNSNFVLFKLFYYIETNQSLTLMTSLYLSLDLLFHFWLLNKVKYVYRLKLTTCVSAVFGFFLTKIFQVLINSCWKQMRRKPECFFLDSRKEIFFRVYFKDQMNFIFTVTFCLDSFPFVSLQWMV